MSHLHQNADLIDVDRSSPTTCPSTRTTAIFEGAFEGVTPGKSPKFGKSAKFEVIKELTRRRRLDRILRWLRSCALCGHIWPPAEILCSHCKGRLLNVMNSGPNLLQDGYPFPVGPVFNFICNPEGSTYNNDDSSFAAFEEFDEFVREIL